MDLRIEKIKHIYIGTWGAREKVSGPGGRSVWWWRRQQEAVRTLRCEPSEDGPTAHTLYLPNHSLCVAHCFCPRWDPPTPNPTVPLPPRGAHHPQANRAMALPGLVAPAPSHFESGPQWRKISGGPSVGPTILTPPSPLSWDPLSL